jgi:hypothetical protein
MEDPKFIEANANVESSPSSEEKPFKWAMDAS